MIGKAHWFKHRTFGWGLTPKTWQGWVYIAIAAFLLAGTFALGKTNPAMMWLFAIIMVILIADVIVMMTQLPKFTDERENYHQLIIERNCSFAAIAALLAIVIYQTYENTGFMVSQTGVTPFDVSLLVVLGVMLVVKIGSTVYVKMKM